jgi:hypothetical protein
VALFKYLLAPAMSPRIRLSFNLLHISSTIASRTVASGINDSKFQFVRTAATFSYLELGHIGAGFGIVVLERRGSIGGAEINRAIPIVIRLDALDRACRVPSPSMC